MPLLSFPNYTHHGGLLRLCNALSNRRHLNAVQVAMNRYAAEIPLLTLDYELPQATLRNVGNHVIAALPVNLVNHNGT